MSSSSSFASAPPPPPPAAQIIPGIPSSCIGRTVDVWAQPADKSFFRQLPEAMPLFLKSGGSKWISKFFRSLLSNATTTTSSTPSMTLLPSTPPAAAAAASNHVMTGDDAPAHITAAAHVKMMNKGAVGHTLMSAWCRPGPKWLVSNDRIAELINAAPTRLSGLLSVNLHDPVAAVAEIDRCAAMRKPDGSRVFVGCRVVPWLWDLPMNDRLYYAFYVRLVEHQLAFCTQVGHTGPNQASWMGHPIPYLSDVARLMPDLQICAGHVGFPWTNEMIAVSYKHKNVVIDTSAYLPKVLPQELISFMNAGGRSRTLFGTNFPQLTWEATMKSAGKYLTPVVGEKVMEKFLVENATRFFRLDSPVPTTSDATAASALERRQKSMKPALVSLISSL